MYILVTKILNETFISYWDVNTCNILMETETDG